jgi:hypothetical protein
VADGYLSIPWWLIDRRGGNFAAARRKYLFLDASRRIQSRLKKDLGINFVVSLDKGLSLVIIFVRINCGWKLLLLDNWRERLEMATDMYYYHCMKSPVLWSKGIIVRTVGVALSADLDPERWRAIGTDLCCFGRAIPWWVGDWWAFGEHRYGARREITEDPGWQGPAYRTCANSAAVCRAFEISRRREALSFSHHEAVAALPTAEQDRLLDRAEREGWSRRQLRCAIKSDARAVHSIEVPTRQSMIIPAAEAVDRITMPVGSAGGSQSLMCTPLPGPPVAAPLALPNLPPLTTTDVTTASARQAESELARFLTRFEITYGAVRGFGPVIERMLEAHAMLSRIVDAEVSDASPSPALAGADPC